MLQTGIEMILGIPGSGKSFHMVERLVDWILLQKRPVYTNLPLVYRVLRKYLELKGGPECVNLIQELTEQRFNKFLGGFGIRQKYISNALAAGTSRSQAIREFEEENNDFEEWYIPAGSVILIDEAHHWYPNPALRNVRKEEPPELMTFLTMHRHGQYLCIFATQADRQISSTIKSLAAQRFVVRRLDKEPVAMGLSFEFLNFPICQYELYYGEDDPEKTKPMRTFVRLLRLPCYQKYFRFYESFTHSGGKYEAQRAIEKARLTAGLEEKKVPKVTLHKKIFKWLFKWMVRITIIVVIAFTFYQCGYQESEEVVLKQKDIFTINGISKDTVYLTDGTEIKVGSSHKGFICNLIYPAQYAIFEDEIKGTTYYVKVSETLTTNSGRFVYDEEADRTAELGIEEPREDETDAEFSIF